MMKNFIFTVVLMLGVLVHTTAATINHDYGKLSIENVLELSKSISKNANDTLYRVDFNSEFDSMKSLLNLNDAQARDLYKLQNDITEQFRNIGNITNEKERTIKLNTLYHEWRRLSKVYILYNTVENQTDDDALMQYRLYWAIVNTTLNYKQYENISLV